MKYCVKSRFKILVTFVSFFLVSLDCYGDDLPRDFYIQEYGAKDVRVMNFPEILEQFSSWGERTFVENHSLWPMLTGKHYAFGLFNGLLVRPNHGPKVLTKLARTGLPLILDQIYLPESKFKTLAFERQCHWNTFQGLTTFGFLLADKVGIQFYGLSILDSAGLGIVKKASKPVYSYETLVYQWLVFDSVDQCRAALWKLQRKYKTMGENIFLDFIPVQSSYGPRYADFFRYAGQTQSFLYIYLVKQKNSANASSNPVYEYLFNSENNSNSLYYNLN